MGIASRRTSGLFFATAIAGALLVVPAAGPAQAEDGCTFQMDLNGDGFTDSLVGVPGEDVGGAVDAGAVTVLLGGPNHKPYGHGGFQLTAASLGGGVAAGDRFGAAIAVGDYDAYGCLDIAIGAPGHNEGAGIVAIAYHLHSVVAAEDVVWVEQSGTGPEDVPESGDGFGSALAYSFNPMYGTPALWVGAPGEDVGTAVDAGSVTELGYGMTENDPITGHVKTWHQGADSLPGAPETGDQFGAALTGGSGWVAMGAPGEDVGTLADAGAVTTLGEHGARLIVTQDSSGVPGAAEAGDRFGAALATTWDCDSDKGTPVIGAPGEDLGSVQDAGIVTVLGDPLGRQGTYAVSQDTAGIPGVAEAGDRFGASVLGDWSGWAAGAPGEDIGTAVDTGLVTDVWQWCADNVNRVGPGLNFAQSTSGVPGTDESGDAFGSSLAVVYFADSHDVTQSTVLVGAPGEDIGTITDAGAVTVIPYVRSTSLLTVKGSAGFDESSSGVSGAAEAGDGFGSSLDSVS